MADCLIALGSNLGDRGGLLRRAIREISRLPGTRLIARSSWRETVALGGPPGQGAFFNGAAFVSSRLPPTVLLSELQRIELTLGRTPARRWAARALDLDLLLHGDAILQSSELIVPHPRMTYRRFVLEPAAEIAPWRVHPECGWTIGQLLLHLDHGANFVAIAADRPLTEQIQIGIAKKFNLPVVRWSPEVSASAQARPKLILATGLVAGMSAQDSRKIHRLPSTGPVSWIGNDAELDPLSESLAAVEAVWPALAAQSVASN
jgi:2-amino-4-hydroxy-6-hydroxymethyldihydropteridine diphosphokinase